MNFGFVKDDYLLMILVKFRCDIKCDLLFNDL